jgi:hypothetical protein
MEASDLKRVKELEAENSQLERMYAELALDNAAMKDLIAEKLKGRRVSMRRRGTSLRCMRDRSAGPVNVYGFLELRITGHRLTPPYVTRS